MSSIATIWMNHIKAADPVLAAIALQIARQSDADVTFDFEAAIAAKLAEWKESPAGQKGNALRYAVIYYQEDIAAANHLRLMLAECNARALQRLSQEQR